MITQDFDTEQRECDDAVVIGPLTHATASSGFRIDGEFEKTINSFSQFDNEAIDALTKFTFLRNSLGIRCGR